ncbi:hypothetical protein [Collimonas humicola]|uniref:hypothetical protein n=1 Tax=Collimonas humicola TaxID=2825886 RepID=UPI001B8CF4AE|nr:hypothetical protein [Collimonas humicola]
MATEAQKIMQANREGVAFGMVEGAAQMRRRMYALFHDCGIAMSPEAQRFLELAERIEILPIQKLRVAA